ncbi:aldehyde dehydrogenase family protein [Neisseria sp. Ec49-e6-T10]|uniref:aldehyde dehydrogenase family protein n=1 Tax=Neisseria sp. Ec49-e6-T10 TaxID=3140744 RepID=UPI003EBACBC6
MIADKDLISIQHARILAENALEAQKKLATFTQAQLDEIIDCVVLELKKHAQSFATMSYEETDFGRWQDKWFKNHFVCTRVYEQIKEMNCVGVLHEDKENGIVNIGVPVGVIIALCPVTSPISTTIYKTLIALKSGNAIIFSPHPHAIKSMSHVLDIVIRVAQEHGLPEGSISYLDTVTKSGTLELMNHPACSLVLMTGVPGMFQAARCTGKPIIYGGTGNGPAFIERTANIEQAAKDIIRSKTFDYGIASSAEQSIVVDECIAQKTKSALQENGAYFMSEAESLKLTELFYYADGRRKKDMIGKSAEFLARRAGFYVPDNTVLLVAERSYVSDSDMYAKEILAPVMAFYVEDDWLHACEKCIELLLNERNAHTLVIHSHNEEVVYQFAMKKPVGRLLVNTPAAFGGMGATTNLFPAMTLGSGSAGYGVTSDNVSPLNLVYMRKVGYGIRQISTLEQDNICQSNPVLEENNIDATQRLQQILLNVINVLNKTPNP